MPCPDRLDCAFLVLVCRLLDGYARSFGSLDEATALGNLRRRPFLSALGRTLSPVGQRLGSKTAAEWNSATSNMKAAAGADEPLAGRRWKLCSSPATDCTYSLSCIHFSEYQNFSSKFCIWFRGWVYLLRTLYSSVSMYDKYYFMLRSCF